MLAALGAWSIDLRKAKTAGEDWLRFAASTSYVPFTAIAAGRNRLGHAWLFGARPYRA